MVQEPIKSRPQTATPDAPTIAPPPIDPATLPAITPKVAPRIPDGDPEEYYMPKRLCPDQKRDAGDGGRPR